MPGKGKGTVAVVGDVHGHLQLALCVLARWQAEQQTPLDAVFLCGDVGTFTHDSQLDNATRRHARENPCELEFLTQWSADPQPGWLRLIFVPESEFGMGLACPVMMVHGNHEGFDHLAELVRDRALPPEPVTSGELPACDSAGLIRYLPSGWAVRLPSGHTVAGIGGIEAGQRDADYHPMAYFDQAAATHLLATGPFDLLISHQAPASVQGPEKGSPTLQVLLDEGLATAWFHGHSIEHPEIVTVGRRRPVTVVPLEDVAFPIKGPRAGDPGEGGWGLAELDGDRVAARKFVPEFWREYRQKHWVDTGEGRLVCPDLWWRWQGRRPGGKR